MWDPHVKAFLLLQAHMSRITLPIADYVGDQTSVLDQAIRIIQASIDVLTELGYLSSCLDMIKLLQCIKSARWPNEGPLSILPGVNPENLKDATSLQELSTMTKAQWAMLAKDLRIPPSQQPGFARAASALPNVTVSIDGVKASSLTVNLKRRNAVVEREARIYAPRFPKPQTEGWFVVVGDLAGGEVTAVRRAGWGPGAGRSVGVGAKPSVASVIKLPEPEGRDARRVDVLVLSDGYPGLEHQVLGVEIPGLPAVEDDVSMSKTQDRTGAGSGDAGGSARGPE